MEQFKFIDYISCPECIKKLGWYPLDLKLTFANQRSRLSRCKTCPNLISTLEKLNKKDTAVSNET